MTAPCLQTRRRIPSVRRLLFASLLTSVVMLVILMGLVSPPSSVPSANVGGGGTSPAIERSSPTGLQSTANLTCQASKMLGDSCSLPGVVRPAPPSTPGVNPKTWTNLTKAEISAPSARYLSMMVFDPVDQYVLLFGGADASGSLSDTWSFAHGQWTQLSPSNSPGARYLSGIAWDAADGYVVMFGGYLYPAAVINNETWTFLHGTWTNHTGTTNQTPGARWRPLMTYDAGDGYVLMYGGTTITTAFSDTWEFLHGNWTLLTVSGSPPPRFRASMIYDPADNYSVVFGGCTNFACASPDATTWEYHNRTWAALSPTTHPSARVYYGLTYSALAKTVLLYGGSTVPTSATGALGDTWNFTAGNWTSLTSSLTVSPPKLAYLTMAFDPLDGYTVAFGGQFATAVYSNLTWALGPSILGPVAVSPGAIDLAQSVTINATPIGHPGYVVYSYTTLPPGCVSANVSALQCTPTSTGVFPVVVVRNDSGGVPSTVNATVVVDPDPVLTSFRASAGSVTAESPVVLTVTASGGAPPLSYRYSSLPTGCVSADRAVLNCTPSLAGTFVIGVNVTDAAHFDVSSTLTLVVNPQPSVTQLSAVPSALDVHQFLQLFALLSGGTAPVHYAWTGLPLGCVSNDSASLGCNPSAPDSGMVTLTATDADGWTANRSVPIAVSGDPSFTSGVDAPRAVDVGTTVSLWANVSGGTGTFGFVYTGAPAGCVLGNSATNTCVPSAAGSFTIEARATDAAGFTIFENISLTVNSALALPTLAATPGAIDLGQNATFAVTPVGGTAPYTFVFSSLPKGCGAVTASGSVACTPRAAGTYVVGVTVKDSLGQTMAGSGSLVVHRDPSVTLLVSNGGSITLGSPLALQARATNGSAGFSYSYSGLPTGCTTQNASALSCTPTATGTYLVTVTVHDSLGVSATAASFANVTASASTTVFGLPATTAYLLIGAIVALVAIAAVVLLARRRKGPPTPAAEQPVAEDWVEGQ